MEAEAMKIQHPLLFSTVGTVGAWGIRRLVGSNHFHFRYDDPNVNPEVARRLGHRYIYAFFHEVMLFPAYFWAWPEMQILISDHRDGEYITRVVRKLGFGVVRGSTTRGGARALKEMIARIDRGHLCVTPDGPRGPRRHVHQGLIYLAAKTGWPIVGAGMAFHRPWRANSWDRFAVPRPFRAACCVTPAPVAVPSDIDREGIEHYRLEVEARMNRATDEAEAWVEHL
jgi:lysophospholipid acyltransferase (LPLAT)-like uncharacterized protein